MFTNQEIIAILFKFINFFTLIGVGYFLFKKYILPDLLLSMATKKQRQDLLYAQQVMLEKQQLNLDVFLKEDAIQCAKFRSNIDTWQYIVTQKNLEYEKEHNTIITLINQRNAQKTLHKKQKHMQQIVTNTIVDKIQKSLSLYFKEQSKNSKYLNDILQFMDEKKS